MDIAVTQNFYAYRVTFNGALHLYIRKDIVAMSSWYDDVATYCIEFTFAGGASLRVEYTAKELWLGVLAKLDTLLR